MSLNKAIAHGQEHRKPYKGAKTFDASCRPNGGCDWCASNRLVGNRRREEAADDSEREGAEAPHP